jgi:tripartite-type tricarboxylate transporter receptor subunit TctC
VPTIAEQGLPNYELQGWFAAIGPAGMAAGDVTRIHAAFKEAVETPQVRGALTQQGYTFLVTGPDESAKYMASETVKMNKLVVAAGVKPD